MEAKLVQFLKNSLLTLAFLTLAFYGSVLLLGHTGKENASTLLFIVAIVLIARYTDGYFYGFAASLISMILVNYAFMYPYEVFTMSITGYPVVGGSFLAASATVSAVTTRLRREIEQNEELFRERTEMRLDAAKSKTRENLLRAISHDLRTPLTAILGASSVIEENYDRLTREEVVQFAQGISTDAQWLIDLVENLLSVTRVNGEGAKIVKRNEIFEEIIAETVYKLRKRFPDHTISVEVPSEVLVVPMDSILIQQVVFNLVENAIKHSESEECIEVRLLRKDSMAVFEVRDHGKGIRFENVDRLIDNVAQNTEEASDSTRGLGLGLSVCQSIIKAHGGFLEAENLEEGGAVFRFGLALSKNTLSE